ncbi:MAG: DUF819 family protein [Pseudomonadota bacterium]
MQPLYVLSMLCAAVAVAHWLAQTRIGRPIGGAILVILIFAALANVGLVPTASTATPLYGQILGVGAPVSIFWLLLGVRLTTLRQAGTPMLILFSLGALGTMVGVFVAGKVTGAADWLGEWYGPLAGMYSATYIGGGANFNALASHYDFFETGNLFAATTVVDHVLTVVWIALLLLLPKLLTPLVGRGSVPEPTTEPTTPDLPDQRLTMGSLAVLLALGFAAHTASVWLSGQLGEALGFGVPSIIILTTLALVLAQVPAVTRIPGAQTLGMYGSYLFLAVLGAYCEAAALMETGRIGLLLFLFVGLALAIHGVILFGAGLALRLPPAMMAVASTANVGGSTVVLPMVQSLGRRDLLLPGVLVGAVGNAAGTYLGFLMVRLVT